LTIESAGRNRNIFTPCGTNPSLTHCVGTGNPNQSWLSPTSQHSPILIPLEDWAFFFSIAVHTIETEEAMSIDSAKQAIETAIHRGDFKSMGIAVFKAINALEERIREMEEEIARLKAKVN
jgi:uncharacterized small protein (DUF1192 family)